MTSQPVVAVVVLGWNNRALLDECFASVIAQTYPAVSLIYVDNGSADDSVEYTKATYPEIEVIATGVNAGFAQGNNVGFTAALKHKSCEYVVALNTDARLEPTWIQTLVTFAQSQPKVACMQGLTLNYYDHMRLDSRGVYIDHRAAPLQIGYNDPPSNEVITKVFGVNAAAAMYTRSFLQAQPFGDDFFDSDMFMYYEDVDISARAITMGYTNYYVPAAIAYHMGSASSGGNPSFMLRMCHQNLPLVLIKNLPASLIIQSLPAWTWVEGRRLYTFLREHRYGLAKAMVVGRLKGLTMLPLFIRKRRRLFRLQRPNRSIYRSLMKLPKA